MRPGQKDVLNRVVIRAPGPSVPRTEAGSVLITGAAGNAGRERATMPAGNDCKQHGLPGPGSACRSVPPAP
jgi:hypothetical protein